MGVAAPSGVWSSTAARGRLRAVVVFVLAGCPVPHEDTGGNDVPVVEPSLVGAKVECAAEAATWSVVLEADAWTGGGSLWMSTDGVYVEQHDFGSYEAAVDGTGDELRLSLAVADERSAVHAGSSTWFNCGVAELQGLLVIRSRDGSTVSDCRAFGGAPERWEAWGVGACTESIEVQAR